MTAWIPIETRKPTEEDADERGLVVAKIKGLGNKLLHWRGFDAPVFKDKLLGWLPVEKSDMDTYETAIVAYEAEKWVVLKDDICAGVNALRMAIEYAKSVETTIEPLKSKLRSDIDIMERSLNRLSSCKQYELFDDVPPPFVPEPPKVRTRPAKWPGDRNTNGEFSDYEDFSYSQAGEICGYAHGDACYRWMNQNGTTYKFCRIPVADAVAVDEEHKVREFRIYDMSNPSREGVCRSHFTHFDVAWDDGYKQYGVLDLSDYRIATVESRKRKEAFAARQKAPAAPVAIDPEGGTSIHPDFVDEVAKVNPGDDKEAIPPCPGDDAWCPDVCPITFRPFFMWIYDPGMGWAPTYGGPFDSYTIPTPCLPENGSKPTPRQNIEFYCERYDHDEGCWREPEDPCLRIIHESDLVELEDKAGVLDKPSSPVSPLPEGDEAWDLNCDQKQDGWRNATQDDIGMMCRARTDMRMPWMTRKLIGISLTFITHDEQGRNQYFQQCQVRMQQWRVATAEDIGKLCRVRDVEGENWREGWWLLNVLDEQCAYRKYRANKELASDVGWEYCEVPVDSQQANLDGDLNLGSCINELNISASVSPSAQSEPQPESRPTNETPEVDWSKAPEWAMFAAMDMRGTWWFYCSQPKIPEPTHWGIADPYTHPKHQAAAFDAPPFQGRWQDSLQQRPRPVDPDPTKEYGDYKCMHGVPSKTCSICSNTSVSEKILNHADQLKKMQWRVATSSDIGAQFEFIRVRDAAYKKDTWSSFGGAVLDHVTENGKFCIVYEDKEWIWDECEVLVSAPARRTPTKEDLKNGEIRAWFRRTLGDQWMIGTLVEIREPCFIMREDYYGIFHYCEIEALSVQPAANNGVME